MSETTRNLHRIALALLASTTAVIGFATVLGFFGAAYWLLDLFAHFRWQYTVLFIGCGGVYAGLARWRPALLCGAGMAINVWCMLPLFVEPPGTAAAGSPRLEVLSFNVNRHNDRYGDISKLLRKSSADVIVLSEVTPAFEEHLHATLSEFTIIAAPRTDAFGIAVLSRQPVLYSGRVDLSGTQHPGGPGRSAIEIRIGGALPLTILGIHPPPPMGSALSQQRDDMIAAVAIWSKQVKGSAIVAGDFNATPWSHAFRSLLADSALVDSARGFGLQRTWPSGMWLLRIPIDHVLHTDDLVTTSRDTGPWTGSDHRPLQVTIAQRAQRSR